MKNKIKLLEEWFHESSSETSLENRHHSPLFESFNKSFFLASYRPSPYPAFLANYTKKLTNDFIGSFKINNLLTLFRYGSRGSRAPEGAVTLQKPLWNFKLRSKAPVSTQSSLTYKKPYSESITKNLYECRDFPTKNVTFFASHFSQGEVFSVFLFLIVFHNITNCVKLPLLNVSTRTIIRSPSVLPSLS